MTEAVQLKSNEFWGKRFGAFDPNKPKPSYNHIWGTVIYVPRGSSTGRKGGVHSGPSGYQTRWYIDRVLKPYKHKK